MKKLIKCKNNLDKEMTIEEVLEEFDGIAVKPCGKWMHTYELEDLRQMARISIMKAYNTYDIKNNIPFVTFAQKIINNDIIGFHKTNTRQKRGNGEITFTSIYAMVDDADDLRVLDTLEDKNVNVEDEVLSYISKNKILEVLKTFSGKEKEMIELYFIKGLNFAEIGRMVGLTREAIRYRINQIRKKLKKQLIEYSY
ncbi:MULTISPECIES: sigma-70 family RNA polymerase sigma factor [unclassified Clostridium]|uniref:sigma-70 family RNA polymerase sigma factor n=1 Tax=unclassified Clostridium TaxID=2614128 RepID=UPI00207AAB25|nr:MULTISPECIES: sigma-70 family RNA polymerase sigma factor [unclassified Clostridium]